MQKQESGSGRPSVLKATARLNGPEAHNRVVGVGDCFCIMQRMSESEFKKIQNFYF
jgi:hypothetical protein